LAGASAYVIANEAGAPPILALALGFSTGLFVRAGAILWGWVWPGYGPGQNNGN
jgi:hypothetical protein